LRALSTARKHRPKSLLRRTARTHNPDTDYEFVPAEAGFGMPNPDLGKGEHRDAGLGLKPAKPAQRAFVPQFSGSEVDDSRNHGRYSRAARPVSADAGLGFWVK